MYFYCPATHGDSNELACLDRTVSGEARADSCSTWCRWTDHAFVWTAASPDGVPVGACVAFSTIKEVHGHLLVFHKLIVHPAHRSRGIASQLVTSLFEQVDQLNYRCSASLDGTDIRTIEFLGRFGFKRYPTAPITERPHEVVLLRHF